MYKRNIQIVINIKISLDLQKKTLEDKSVIDNTKLNHWLCAEKLFLLSKTKK